MSQPKNQWIGEHPAQALALGSVVLGALGGLGFGWAGAYMSDNQSLEAAGQTARWFWLPEPVSLGVGFAVCAALTYALGRVLQGASALRNHQLVRERLERAGIVLGPEPKLSLLKIAEAEEAAAAVLEKSATFVLGARKELAKYKDALSTYADPTLASKLHLETGYKNLPTTKVRCAILFCDIRGFTKMSEALKVEEVVSVLNDYFSLGAKAVDGNQGQINKFIGDAILAVFQDPPNYVSGVQASRNAVNAGMELIAKFRQQKATWRDRIGTPFDADLGVGIHFGEVILGSMGSPQRMEYTVIGDTVNFSSRLCSLAAAGQLRVSEECFKNVEGYFKGDEMEPVKVKGKSGEYKTYLITEKKPGA
jgi:class 3 adenylate cyclase